MTSKMFFVYMTDSEDELDDEDLALIQENTGIKLRKVSYN